MNGDLGLESREKANEKGGMNFGEWLDRQLGAAYDLVGDTLGTAGNVIVAPLAGVGVGLVVGAFAAPVVAVGAGLVVGALILGSRFMLHRRY